MIGAVALIALAGVAGAGEQVVVDAGPLTGALVALLRVERPDVAFTSSAAASGVRVALRRENARLSLAVVREGAPRIARVIAVEHDALKPALRIAALLVVEALGPRPDTASSDATAARVAASVSDATVAARGNADASRDRANASRDGSGANGAARDASPANVSRDGTSADGARDGATAKASRDATSADDARDGSSANAASDGTGAKGTAREGSSVDASRDGTGANGAPREGSSVDASRDATGAAGDGSLAQDAREPSRDTTPETERAATNTQPFDPAPRGGSLKATQGPHDWSIGVAIQAASWARPLVPRFGPAATAHRRFGDDLAAGIRLESSGLFCCDLDTPELHATVREAAAYVDATYDLTELRTLRIFATGALGAGYTRYVGYETFNDQPDVRSTTQPHTAVEGALRLGAGLDLPLGTSGVHLTLTAGARLRAFRLTVQNAKSFQGADTGYDPGVLAPFLELGTSMDVL